MDALNNYYQAATAMAVMAFENQGHLPSGLASNPYTAETTLCTNDVSATQNVNPRTTHAIPIKIAFIMLHLLVRPGGRNCAEA